MSHRFCTQCGTKNEAVNRFCEQCGASLNSVTDRPKPSPVVAPPVSSSMPAASTSSSAPRGQRRAVVIGAAVLSANLVVGGAAYLASDLLGEDGGSGGWPGNRMNPLIGRWVPVASGNLLDLAGAIMGPIEFKDDRATIQGETVMVRYAVDGERVSVIAKETQMGLEVVLESASIAVIDFGGLRFKYRREP